MHQQPYDEAYKAAIVQRVLGGTAPHAIEKELGKPQAATIRKWLKEAEGATEKREIIQKHIAKPKVGFAPVRASNRVLVIPDLHCPFEHPDALPFLMAVRDAYKTNLTVCEGDEIDAASMSRYPKDPDGMNPGKELAEAIEHLRPFYREFPEVLVCESNHTVRPWKLAFEAGLPASFLPTISKVLDAPDGWIWKPRHEIDGVLYTHGDNGKSGQYAHVHYMKQAKQSVVIGHIHAFAGVNYEGPHFGMNAGCLIDRDAYCFKYAKGALLDVSIGCGVVIDGKEAYFIPMRQENGRWTGKL